MGRTPKGRYIHVVSQAQSLKGYVRFRECEAPMCLFTLTTAASLGHC